MSLLFLLKQKKIPPDGYLSYLAKISKHNDSQ